MDYIVVGGVAAIIHGAPLSTRDLDILFNPTPENIDNLLRVLHELEATYLDPAGRVFVPDEEKLSTFQIHLLQTSLGRLDILRTVGDGLDFNDFSSRTIIVEVDEMAISVLDLHAIIEVKQAAGRPKDQIALPFLLQLAEMRRSASEEEEE